MFAFQNCSQKGFDTGLANLSSTSLVPVIGKNITKTSAETDNSTPNCPEAGWKCLVTTAHSNMYDDMRRLLKLGPNDQPRPEPNCLQATCDNQIPKSMSIKVNGVAMGSVFTQGDVLEAEVYGFEEQDTYGCIEIVGKSSCPGSAFAKLPNNDWKFSDGVWRATINSANYPAQVYRGYTKNSKGEQVVYTLDVRERLQSRAVSGTGTPTRAIAIEKKTIFSVNGQVRSDGIFVQGEILVGQVIGFEENDTYACIEIVGKSSCTQTGFTKLPNSDWKFSNGVWSASINSGLYPPQLYRGYTKNSAGEVSSFTIDLRPAGSVISTSPFIIGGSISGQ